MESTYSSVNLYELFNQKTCRSPPLSISRSSPTPAGAPLGTPIPASKEEGSARQTDNFSLVDLRETLKALDDSSEIHRLAGLLTFCSACRAFMNMGNQQVTKPKPSCYGESWDASPRVYIPRKRRRREATPLRQSSSMLGEDFPARRQTVTKKEREDKSSRALKQNWNQKLPDASPASLQKTLSKKGQLSPKKNNSADSDSDLSEYDNEAFSFFYPNMEVKSGAGESERTNTKDVDAKASQEAAAQRLMSKIEEVEGIIRRVSLSSSDWMREDEPQMDSSGGTQQIMEQRCKTEFSIQSRLESGEDRNWLGESLDRSLHRDLTMEGDKSDTEKLSNRLPLNSHLHPFIPSSPSHSPTPSESSSSERLSPILSSPLTSSLTDVTKPNETLGVWTNSGKDARILKEDGGCESGTRSYGETGSGWGETQEQLPWSTLKLKEEYLLSSDEALQQQQEVWQQEVEDSLSRCRSLFHPTRPKHIDFLCITAADDDITDTPTDMPVLQLRTDARSPGDGGERTPGRLHAVWPPLKVEKVGLKYTEAEHQAALLQLKREREEELEKLQEDYELKLSRQKLENKEKIFRLESVLNDLQAKLSQVWTHQPGEQKDEAVLTTDDFLHKSFRTVGIQTDREAFIRISEDEDVPRRACRSPLLQKVAPNKLGMVSIRLSLAGQKDESLSSSSAPETCVHPLPPEDTQPHSEPAGPTKQITPPLPPSLCPAPPPPPLPPPLPVPGAAPPPPPPLAGGLIIDKPPRKPALEPSRPMKPLYWTRIQIQDDNNNSLWNILEEHRIINASEFEDLFAKTITKTKRKPLSEAYEKKAKARKIIKLLDSKRSQAVGILISSLHLEMKDIQQAVVAVDHSVVDLEAIEALYDNRGHPEELEKIGKHYETSKEEDVKLLDKPEQFLYELSQIPDFASRAWCIIFKSTFIDGITSIKRKLNSVSSVCKVLLESSSVREVMGLVLALGNHMNGGNRVRGQADGFGLEILPKLKDVKSKDNRISLVDYVVSYYLHNVDKNSGTDKSAFPLPDPQDVFLAAQVKFDDLSGDLKQLQQDLSKCEKNVQKVCSDSPEELLQPFKDKMEAFVLSARKEHAEMSYQLTTAQQSFQDLVLYFGLKPKPGEKEVTTGHLFMLWFEFCGDFKSRWKRENKNISKQRYESARNTNRPLKHLIKIRIFILHKA